MILETQQNSDTTYRVYGYNRTDDGDPRPLIYSTNKDVTTIPHGVPTTDQQVANQRRLERERLCGKQVLYGLEIRY